MHIPKVWVVQENEDRYHIAIDGKPFYLTDNFFKASDVAELVDRFYNCLQELEDFIDTSTRDIIRSHEN